MVNIVLDRITGSTGRCCTRSCFIMAKPLPFALNYLTCNAAALHYRGVVLDGVNKMPILFILFIPSNNDPAQFHTP